jgi:hypothetical protein
MPLQIDRIYDQTKYQEEKMRKNPFLPRLTLLVFVSVLALLSLAECSSSGSSPPEFVGTWKCTSPALITITLTETTFASVAGVLSGDSESITGTITSYDTTTKHILALVATESYTGNAPTTPTLPGTKLYMLYSLSGTTLNLSLGQPGQGYPTDLSSAYVFTKQ